MLEKINYDDKSQSTYLCDRCKKNVFTEQKRAVYIANPYKTPRKRWDLCLHCYKMLCNGIINYQK